MRVLYLQIYYYNLTIILTSNETTEEDNESIFEAKEI